MRSSFVGNGNLRSDGNKVAELSIPSIPIAEGKFDEAELALSWREELERDNDSEEEVAEMEFAEVLGDFAGVLGEFAGVVAEFAGA